MGQRWADARRIEAWAGEIRVNLIRLVALLAFYLHHLLNVYVFADPAASGAYHTTATTIALAWGFSVMILHVALSRRWHPPALMYAAVVWDGLLVTTLLVASGGAPSPLVILYFLLIATAPLRLSLGLVYAAVGVSLSGFLFLQAHAAWIAADVPRMPRPAQIIFLIGLGVAGLLAGQSVRQARRLVQGYPVTVEDRRE